MWLAGGGAEGEKGELPRQREGKMREERRGCDCE